MAGRHIRSIAFRDGTLELRACDRASDGEFIRTETAQNFQRLTEATYGWNEERHQKEPSQPGDYTMVCFEGERIGFFALLDKPDCSYLSSIQLVPTVRGSGIGTTLMEHIESLARATGHRTIRLRVFHANRAASLYRRLGYVVESSDEHSAIMRKML